MTLDEIKALAESFLEEDEMTDANAILWANQCQCDEFGENAWYNKSFNITQTYEYGYTDLPSDFLSILKIFAYKVYGVCDADCTTTSIILKTNGSTVDDAYNGMVIAIGSEVKAITDYDGAGLEVTCAAFTDAPAEDTQYIVSNGQDYYSGAFDIRLGQIRMGTTGEWTAYYRALPSDMTLASDTPNAHTLLHRCMAYYLAARYKLYDDEESVDGLRLMKEFYYHKQIAINRLIRLEKPNYVQREPGYGRGTGIW